MSFLARIFGSTDPVETIRKAARQGRHAEVLSRCRELDLERLAPAEREELLACRDAAAAKLAQLNLEEGGACRRGGEVKRAIEHFELVLQLTADATLRHAAETQLSELGAQVAPPPAAAAACSSSCCDHGHAGGEVVEEPHDFDEETRFELILAAYPEKEKERYRQLSAEMKRGVLAAHEERDDEALALFAAIPIEGRDPLFAYEYGALLGRVGRYEEGVSWLQRACAGMGGHLMAVTTLVDLHLKQRNFAAAEQMLQSLLPLPQAAPYAHAQLSFICQAKQEPAAARQHAEAALQQGYREKSLMIYLAEVLEAEGRTDEAEQLLQMLPGGGGCGGGGHVELAEFWLRHKRQLSKALEMFKKGAQSDPGNPVWVLRIAQAYLALGWKRDAMPMLETLVASDLVDETVRAEAAALLAAD